MWPTLLAVSAVGIFLATGYGIFLVMSSLFTRSTAEPKETCCQDPDNRGSHVGLQSLALSFLS